MVDVYKASKKKNSTARKATKGHGKKAKKAERLSVREIKKVIGHNGKEGVFTSFVTFPTQVCLDVQEPGEEVVLFLRQHPIVNLKWFVVALLISFVPSFFEFFPMYTTMPSGYQFVLTMGWYLLVFGYVLGNLMNWFFNVFVVTDERLIDADFENLFTRVISEAKLDKLQDTHSRMSGAGKLLFNYGDVAIQTAGENQEFTFQNVPHPDLVAKYISQLIDLEEQEKLDGRVK